LGFLDLARIEFSGDPRLPHSERGPLANAAITAEIEDGEHVTKEAREIRCYDYVNHPYEPVRDALRTDATRVFQTATKSAVDRAEAVAAELHVDFGRIGVRADVNVSVKKIEETLKGTPSPSTHLTLEWKAVMFPGLFPVMKATFSIYPLTGSETQLDFLGNYEPPFGAVGKAMNAIVGYRIAEVSVHRFVEDVAKYLRQALAS
jgi:ribosome-associated toxin RatA of RatAB toxin-antitoxin module